MTRRPEPQAREMPLPNLKSRTRPHYSEMGTRASMPLSILGINHKTAPVALREKVAFAEERLLAALRTLRQEQGVSEVVILSTCNRTEVYWSGSASGAELSRWLERHHDPALDLAPSLY